MTDLRTTGGEEALRERAIARLKKKSDFRAHLLAYLLVNGFIVVIWAITSSGPETMNIGEPSLRPATR